MSQNKLQLDGLSELRDALRSLPEDLALEAGGIVRQHADDARSLIEAAYPQGRTGNLKRGVTVEHNSSKFAASAIVRSRAKHASIYERGTAPRRTAAGANRGRMPPAPEGHRMIPIVVRVRSRMVQALIDFVRAKGFQVNA